MCTHRARANICCRADSCSPSLPEVNQWYLLMVSFVSSCRTYCRSILSVPSRSSSLMDVDFENVEYMQTGSVVVLVIAYRITKQINLLLALAHSRGPRCHEGCGIRCLASSIRKGLWSSCQNNCLRSCSALYNILHSLLLPALHGSK